MTTFTAYTQIRSGSEFPGFAGAVHRPALAETVRIRPDEVRSFDLQPHTLQTEHGTKQVIACTLTDRTKLLLDITPGEFQRFLHEKSKR